MSTIAVLNSFWMRWMTSRICACTVTSSAVVGSSAISTSGSLAIAIAIITRWRMPPENSCGYCSARWSGCGMPTMSSNSTALRCAAAFGSVLVRLDHLDDLDADLVHRVERRQRILEDHRDPLAADVRMQLVGRRRPARLPPTLAEPEIFADFGSSPIRPRNVTDLPEPRLADDADHLAVADVEVDAANRLDIAVHRVE